MPKWKLLSLGILFAMLACIIFIADSFNPSALWLGLPAVLCLARWYYKHQRDRRILSQAAQQRQLATQTPQTIPPKTREGNRLFMPQPLDQDTRRH